jgi:hypothetical protein
VTVAYLALVLWFVVTPALFFYFRPPTAAALSFLGAALFLPNNVGVDVPLLPPIGKEEVASIACLLSCLWFAIPALRAARLGRGPEVLLVVIAGAIVVSVLGNREPLIYGPFVVPGVKPMDVPALVIEEVLRWGIPFYVGRALFVRARDVRNLMIVFAVACLVYSLFILVELRMSPQFHRWTYGFHQHSFHQTIRESGYRPMVYMRHGLHVALFVMLSLAATLTLARVRHRFWGVPASWVSAYLAGILVLCKSIGAIGYALLTCPLILLARPRLQMAAAVGGVCFIAAYPLIRTFDLVPLSVIEQVAEAAAGPRRAASLVGRMRVEIAVIEFSMSRLWFGWGNSGRAMQRDPESGRVLIVFDGFWIVAIAKGGLVAAACVFVLLLAPVVSAWRAFPQIRAPADRTLVAGLSLLVVVNVVDLLPNSTTEGYLTLMSGALAGAVPGILREQARARARRAPEPDGLGKGLLGVGRITARSDA